MKIENVASAYNTLGKLNTMEALLYYLTEPEEYVLTEVNLKFKNGKEIRNVPIAIRNIVRKTLVKELGAIIKEYKKEIEEID